MCPIICWFVCLFVATVATCSWWWWQRSIFILAGVSNASDSNECLVQNRVSELFSVCLQECKVNMQQQTLSWKTLTRICNSRQIVRNLFESLFFPYKTSSYFKCMSVYVFVPLPLPPPTTKFFVGIDVCIRIERRNVEYNSRHGTIRMQHTFARKSKSKPKQKQKQKQ